MKSLVNSKDCQVTWHWRFEKESLHLTGFRGLGFVTGLFRSPSSSHCPVNLATIGCASDIPKLTETAPVLRLERRPWARLARTALHRSRRTRRVFRKSSSPGIIFALSPTARYTLANSGHNFHSSASNSSCSIFQAFNFSQFDYELREYVIVVDFVVWIMTFPKP